MKFASAVFCGLLFSYIISCIKDFGPYLKDWENLPKAILSAWYAAVISLISRIIFIYLILHLLVNTSMRIFPNVLKNMTSYMFIASIFSAILITLPPQVISKILKKQAEDKLNLKWWMKILISSDNLSWERIIFKLEFIRAEQTNEIWMEKDNRWAVFILYEEKKDAIIRYHFKNKRGFSDKLWLYLGLLSGNNNSKRAEALIHLYGTKWLKKELYVLKEGKRTSEIPVKKDRRKFSFNRLDNPPLSDLELGNRRCDHLILELLNNL